MLRGHWSKGPGTRLPQCAEPFTCTIPLTHYNVEVAGGSISIFQIGQLRVTKVQVSAQRHYFLPEAVTTGLAQPPVTSLSPDLSTVLKTVQNYFVKWFVSTVTWTMLFVTATPAPTPESGTQSTCPKG